MSCNLLNNCRREYFRILLAAILLAATAVTGLPTMAKLSCVILAMFILLVRRRREESCSELTAFAVCFSVSIGVISVCSKSSFLYPLNDWVDANCFFTVGKSMMNGVVVYRDLLEQKGPFLYVIHGIAWLISNDSFAGVYLFEIIAATFFLFYIHRSICLFVTSDWSVFFIPVYATIIYTSQSFCHGDSVEELSLPFYAYAMWIGMDAVCNKRKITRREYFLVGLTSGLIFWSKFTAVGFYVGWYLLPAANNIKSKNWRDLLQSVLYILLGVVTATLPFIIYFGINGAISDWLKVYLYNNLFLYAKIDTQQPALWGLVYNVLIGTFKTVSKNPFIPVMSLVALIYFLCKHIVIGIYFIAMAVFMILFAFIGGTYYPYYSFCLNLFLPFGVLPVLHKIAQVPQDRLWLIAKEKNLVPVIAFFLAVCLIATPNRYLLGVEKEKMPQYQFASIVGNDGSAKLLNYGFLDGGFYTVCNVIPEAKVFCLLNISQESLKQIQDNYIEQGIFEYVVTRDKELTNTKYTCVSTSTFFLEDKNHIYYLYQLQ